MSRRAGFATADIATDLLDDLKVRTLYRASPEKAAEGIVLYLAVVLSSWKEGQRVPAQQAAPLWLNVGDLAALLARLDIGLLDSTGRIPEHAWASWYEPAARRRDAALARWDRANKKRAAEHGQQVRPLNEPKAEGAIRPLRFEAEARASMVRDLGLGKPVPSGA